MRWWHRLWLRKKMEDELEKELLFHLDQHTADLIAQGLDPEEARRQARLALGGPEQVKEECRDARGTRGVEDLLQDLRYGMRMLLKNPGFTTIAVLTLALGIGANSSIFSLVNTILLRPLTYRDPDRLVMIWEDATLAGFPRDNPAPANYVDWKAQNHVFENMAAVKWHNFNLTGQGEPLMITALGATGDFFSLLGVEPALGRTILPEDDHPGHDRVVVLSYKLWQNRFGGASNILGKDILLNNEKYKIVGVMPAGFQFWSSFIDLWIPTGFTQGELAIRKGHYLMVVARMKKGVTVEQANADIKTIMWRIAHDHPQEAGKLGANVIPLHEQLAGEVPRQLTMLLIAVGFVLLIACANIANLLLSRAAARGREIAVRLALGASRWRILRQLLTESLVLSGLGGMLGVWLATWSFVFLEKMIPETMGLSTKLDLDWRVLAYTLLVSLLTGVIFGIAPALQASKTDLNNTLKQGHGSIGSGAGHRRLRGAFVVGEMAIALVLLVGAGLLIQTSYRLLDQYSVLHPQHLLLLSTPLPMEKYSDHTRRTSFYDQALERVRALPGVVSAGYTTSVPLYWKGGSSVFTIEGRSDQEAKAMGLSFDANHRQIDADFFEAMGIPLKRGRYFNEGDTLQTVPVAIINETMARAYWPNESPLGKRFSIDSAHWITIVGVVADIRQVGLDVPAKAEMYFPYRQSTAQPWLAPTQMVVRASVDPLSLVEAIRRDVQTVDPDQPVSNAMTMGQLLDQETSSRRLGMVLLTAFAGMALLLASLGIYGVLSYFVVQHTPEIGVRLALGAQQRDILALILRKGMILALSGAAIGLAISFALTRLMSSLLYDVSPTDIRTFGITAFLLTTISLLACYIPARKAARVDPMIALRYE